MSSFASELGATFPHEIESPHVIEPSQLWAGVLSSGPNANRLVGTYKTFETFQYQDDLGQLILRITKIAPEGVLVFVPSYLYISSLKIDGLKSLLVVGNKPRFGNSLKPKNTLFSNRVPLTNRI
jgi:hypothetical protein